MANDNLMANGDFEQELAPSVQADDADKLVEGRTEERPASGRFAYRVFSIESPHSPRHDWRLRPGFVAPGTPVDVSFAIRRNRLSNPGTHFWEHGGPIPVAIALYDEDAGQDALTLFQGSTFLLTGEWRRFEAKGVTLPPGRNYSIRCKALWLGGDQLFDLDDIRVVPAERPAVSHVVGEASLSNLERFDPFQMRQGLTAVSLINGLGEPLEGTLEASAEGDGLAPARVVIPVAVPPGAAARVHFNLAPAAVGFPRQVRVGVSLRRGGEVLAQVAGMFPLTPTFYAQTTLADGGRAPAAGGALAWTTEILGDAEALHPPLSVVQTLEDAYGRVLAETPPAAVEKVPSSIDRAFEGVAGAAGEVRLVSRIYWDKRLVDKESVAMVFPGEAAPPAAPRPARDFPFRVEKAWEMEVEQPHDVLWADLSGEGTLDIVVAQYFPKKVAAFGGARRQKLWEFPTRSLADRIAAADLTGDGRAEIAVADFNRPGKRIGTLFVLKPDGNLHWEAPLRGPGHGVAIGDFDGDGGPEVAVGTCFSQVHFFTAQGTPTSIRWACPGRWASVDVLAAGDLEGRGRDDLVGARWGWGNATLFRFDGMGRVLWNRVLAMDVSGPYASDVVLGDLTGDGQLEVVAAVCAEPSPRDMRGADWVQAFRHDGSLLWRHGSPGFPTLTRGGLAVLDLDGDGRPEVLSIARRMDRPGQYALEVLSADGALLLHHPFKVEGPSEPYSWNGWQMDARPLEGGGAEIVFAASSESRLVGLKIVPENR